MSYRRLLAALGSAAILAACHGGGAPSIPATTYQGVPQAARGDAAAGAGGITFEALGPTHMTSGLVGNSGKTNAYAVDPTNPQSIYLASGRGTGLESYSSAGIYHSTDGGKSWSAAVAGLTDISGLISSVVNTLWIDPNDPAHMFAGSEYDGVFLSRDRGASWHNAYRTTQTTQFFEIGKDIYATSSAGVLVSKDGGEKWSVSLSGVQPTALGATSHAAGTTLYAGTTLGVIEALDGGSWHKLTTLPFTADTHTQGSTPAVHQLAVDPYDASTIFASTNDGEWDQELFGSSDGGKTWVAVLKKTTYELGLGPQAIAFSLVHKHRLYIGMDGAFYYVDGGPKTPVPAQAANLSVIDIRDVWVEPGTTDDACVIASDQGLDRVPQCSTPTHYPQDDVVSKTVAIGLARHFAISPNGATLFVSLQDFNSHITFNGGHTWTETPFYEDGFNEMRPGSPNNCYVLDEAYGLSYSDDGCHNFGKPSKAQAAIVPSRLMLAPIAFDPKNPLIMYLLSGPVEAPGIKGVRAIFHTEDGGTSFSKEAWPFNHAGTIVVDSHDGAHIAISDLSVAGTSSISITTNGGKTWTHAKGVPPTVFWYAISFSPVNGGTLLASSVDASNNVFVLRSTDGGKTFTKTQVVVNAPALRGRLDTDRTPRLGAHPAGVDVDAGEPPAAFLYSPVREIRYDQDRTTGVADAVLTTLRGAYLSGDDGVTWHRIDLGTISHSFWGARWNGGYLYLGSDGQGLLRSKVRVETP